MALWFLQVLFGNFVLYVIIDYIVRKLVKKETLHEIAMGAVALALLILGWRMSSLRVNLHGFEKVFSYFVLFYSGRLIRRHDHIDFQWLQMASVRVKYPTSC